MSRHRIFAGIALHADSDTTLEGAQAHYLGHVLRVRPNDTVTLFDGSGAEFESVVKRIGRKRVELSVGGMTHPNTESPMRVTLLQSVLRGERMDFCIQKSTELGVHRIVPILTERTVVKIPAHRMAKRLDHWHKIAVSACEQSGRVTVPSVTEPMPLGDAIEAVLDDAWILLLDPRAEAPSLDTLSPPPGDRITACVGPEGGFTPAEVDLLHAKGALSVTCGPRILRSETAGMVAVAACQMLWGDWSTNAPV